MHQRVYRALLALYPSSFRADLAHDLLQTFGEMIDDRGAGHAWRRTIADLTVTVPRYQLENIMKTFSPGAALKLLVVLMAVSVLTMFTVGPVVALPLLGLAVVLVVTQRSRLGLMRQEAKHSRRRSRLVTAAVLAIVFIGTVSSWVYHINSYQSLGDPTVLVHNLIGVPALVGAFGYLVAGLLTRRPTPRTSG